MAKTRGKRAAKKSVRRAKPARRAKKSARNINAPRKIVEERISHETFQLPVAAHRAQQEADVPEINIYPLDVHPVAKAEAAPAKTAGMPHLATSVLAAGAIALITLAFFLMFMQFELLYALAVAIPVFFAFAIAINGMLEERRR